MELTPAIFRQADLPLRDYFPDPSASPRRWPPQQPSMRAGHVTIDCDFEGTCLLASAIGLCAVNCPTSDKKLARLSAFNERADGWRFRRRFVQIEILQKIAVRHTKNPVEEQGRSPKGGTVLAK